ncbi:MAG: polyamine aminopropyltransferase [Rhodospirillales bacterium]|nr:polyamine aminopropyltransferase [Rhodospirillales bacterium]
MLHDGAVSHGYAQRFEVSRVVYRNKTDFQDLIIFETPHFGRVLALDGIIQTTERDEFAYHEMLAHVPLFAHGEPARVLIIGGGDGGVLREVLRHDVETATMVEIDRTVVDLCREYMPGLSDGAFDDPRADLLITDGLKFVAETQQTFDVIIVDSTDPVGPGEVLFSEAFYADCKKRLTPGGILVTQNGVPSFQGDEVTNSYRRLSSQFADVSFYLTVVPSYVGGFMALGWATDDAALRVQTQADIAPRFEGAGFATRYYTPAVHAAAFALPPFIAELLK